MRVTPICLWAATFVTILGIAAVPAEAGSIVIDFEHFPGPDGVLGTADDVPSVSGAIDTQFSTLGITFVPHGLIAFALFPGTTSSNHYLSDSNSLPLDATLSVPVFGVSIQSYSVWTETLYAFDAGNNILASNTLTVGPCCSFLFGTLSVTTNQPISSFAVIANGCTIGVRCAEISNLDNLTLTTAPEPATSGMVAAPLAIYLIFRVRRRRVALSDPIPPK